MYTWPNAFIVSRPVLCSGPWSSGGGYSIAEHISLPIISFQCFRNCRQTLLSWSQKCPKTSSCLQLLNHQNLYTPFIVRPKKVDFITSVLHIEFHLINSVCPLVFIAINETLDYILHPCSHANTTFCVTYIIVACYISSQSCGIGLTAVRKLSFIYCS